MLATRVCYAAPARHVRPIRTALPGGTVHRGARSCRKAQFRVHAADENAVADEDMPPTTKPKGKKGAGRKLKKQLKVWGHEASRIQAPCVKFCQTVLVHHKFALPACEIRSSPGGSPRKEMHPAMVPGLAVNLMRTAVRCMITAQKSTWHLSSEFRRRLQALEAKLEELNVSPLQFSPVAPPLAEDVPLTTTELAAVVDGVIQRVHTIPNPLPKCTDSRAATFTTCSDC